MPAALFAKGEFTVGEIDLPALKPDQIRVQPLANGICGSDLSAWEHTADFLAANDAAGSRGFTFDPDRPLVFGHEFTARVLEVGDQIDAYAVGEVIFTLPWVLDDAGTVRTIGYVNEYPGGLSAEAIVGGAGHIVLPDGVDPYLAATLEPVATGVSGVRRTGIEAANGAIVTGVGPVGLGAVVELAARGVHPIVASDPSAARREVALAYGATVAVDPREDDPVEAWRALAPAGSRLYVIEASAARGLLNTLIQTAPDYTVFGIVGSQPVPDELRTMSAVIKNASLLFATGADFGEQRYEGLYRAVEHLVEGRYDPALMVTAYTGLAGAQRAFEALRPAAGAMEQIKILIRPDLDLDVLVSPAELPLAAG